jgi:hypothetical protein
VTECCGTRRILRHRDCRRSVIQVGAFVLAAALALALLGAHAADLAVWWEKGWYPEEDKAVAELVAAFEQKTEKKDRPPPAHNG